MSKAREKQKAKRQTERAKRKLVWRRWQKMCKNVRKIRNQIAAGVQLAVAPHWTLDPVSSGIPASCTEDGVEGSDKGQGTHTQSVGQPAAMGAPLTSAT